MLWAAYVAAALVLLCLGFAYLVVMREATSDSEVISIVHAWIVLVILVAVLMPARTYRRVINLGGRRLDCDWASLMVNTLLAALGGIIMVVVHATLDVFIAQRSYAVVSIMDGFGFTAHGSVVAFLQMTAWLLAVASFAQALTLANTRWYGWVADILIVALVVVSASTTALRGVLTWIFDLTIFGAPGIQVTSCLVLAALLTSLSKVLLDRKDFWQTVCLLRQPGPAMKHVPREDGDSDAAH